MQRTLSFPPRRLHTLSVLFTQDSHQLSLYHPVELGQSEAHGCPKTDKQRHTKAYNLRVTPTYACMYACMYAMCIYVCIHVYTYIYMYGCVQHATCICACIHNCKHAWMQACKHICIYAGTQSHTVVATQLQIVTHTLRGAALPYNLLQART